ncbi:MAG: helix-turn-helix domain-containing protein [Marinisporobacter sp.]|jgi:transcriptional regulator with XRE-family HTH domain|nr:helix-turn-helix domain-containing protein [Marinisporobacter sp.]
MKTIGERIKELREAKGLNSKEIANMLDINTSTYSKLENNKKSIGVLELRKITEYFSVSADYILGTNKPEADMVMYMKREKNMSEEDIEEVQMILSMMDEAITLFNMKKRI